MLLWIETRTAYKWVINVRILLYAVCLSLSTFSSVVHFRCRLHFWVQTLKGERFSGWILSAGGRFRPKRLAAPTFQLSRADVLPSQTSKGKGRMTESGNSENRRLMINQIKFYPAIMKKTPPFCSFIKKLYLCSKMSCTSMQITQVCRNQNSCQLITSFLNFPHKLFILSGLWDYSKYSKCFCFNV